MTTKNFLIRLSFIVGLALTMQSASIQGAQYFQDFSGSAAGATNFGDGSAFFSTSTSPTVGVVGTAKELQMTHTSAATSSALILPLLDTNNAIVTAFSAKWNAVISGPFPNAADGFSFNFGPFAADTNLIRAGIFQEAGYTNGLSFCVQTFPGNSPGFYLRAHGTTIASFPYDSGTQWGTNNLARHYFEVDWNLASGMTVKVDHQVIFANVAMTGFYPKAGDRFVWGARTGGSKEIVRLDNLLVMSRGNLRKLTVGSPFFQDARAQGSGSAIFANDFNTPYWSRTNAGYAGGTLSLPASVKAYMIATDSNTDSNTAQSRPGQWVLEGSNNGGGSWGGANAILSADLSAPSQSWVWPTTDTNAYSAWRLNVLTNRGSSDLYIEEVELYELAAAPAHIVASTNQGNFGFFDAKYFPQPMSFGFTVYPEGSDTTVTFVWGTTTAYGNTFTTNVPGGLSPVAVLASLGFPEGGKDYHFRITVQNAGGIVQTIDQVFHVPSYASWDPGTGNDRNQDTAVVAADFDYDGRMDLLKSGLRASPSDPNGTTAAPLTRVARNNFQRSLNQLQTAEPLDYPIITGSKWAEHDVCHGATAIADFNNDGRLDLYRNGVYLYYNNYQTGGEPDIFYAQQSLYVGVSNNIATFPIPMDYQFLPQTPEFSGGLFTSASVADFNGDGRTDILVCNSWPGKFVEWNNFPWSIKKPTLGLNRAHGTRFISSGQPRPGNDAIDFTPVECVLPATNTLDVLSPPPKLIEADFDNDGDLDVLYAPYGLFSNDGEGRFTFMPNALPGGNIINAAWGDYDNDGDLDVVVSYQEPRISILYRNDGGGTFTDTGTSFPIAGDSDEMPVLAWADLNNNGQLDLCYRYNRGVLHKVYYNQNGVFTVKTLPSEGQTMRNFSKEAITFADYNGDGRLDIVETGGYRFANASVPRSFITFNFEGAPNQPPTPPTGLSSTTAPGSVTLNWGQGADDVTPSTTLSYNLRIGTTPGGSDIISPLSYANGQRRVSVPGNKGLTHTTTLRLAPGTYYWSVQSIDGGFLGSPFSTEASFTITGQTAPYFQDLLIVKNVTATSATLYVPAWTGYEDAQVTVQYGLTTNYGQNFSYSLSATNEAFECIGDGQTTLSTNRNVLSMHRVSPVLTNLWSGQQYHCRMVINNSVGTTYSPNITFKTATGGPIGITVANSSSDQFTLSWPDEAGYQLEYRNDLNTGTWLPAGGSPVSTDGINSLQLSKSGAARFFRLHKP